MSGPFIVVRVTDNYEDGDETYLDIIGSRAKIEDAVVVTPADVETDELIELLDQDATGANWHDFVGWAEKLAGMIADNFYSCYTPDELSKRVLWDIACCGGFTEGA